VRGCTSVRRTVFDYSGRVTIPAPPWQRPSRSRPVKPPLGRDAIVAAAMTVLDAEGLAGLSMRRVAQELDTGPASLYAHVSNRDELEELVYDRILGEVPVPEPDPRRWQEQLRQLMRDVVAALGRHPGSARMAMGRVPFTPNALVLEEATLALMRCGGLPERTAALGIDLLFLYATATAFEDSVSANDWGDEETARALVGDGVGYDHAAVNPVKRERLSDPARSKACAATGEAVVAAAHVRPETIGRIPTHQTFGRQRAGAEGGALARTAGREDSLNFKRRKRATIDARLVYLPVEVVPAAVACGPARRVARPELILVSSRVSLLREAAAGN